jgi:hypothetical protein
VREREEREEREERGHGEGHAATGTRGWGPCDSRATATKGIIDAEQRKRRERGEREEREGEARES